MTVATTAPLPAFRHWRALLSADGRDDAALAAPWLHDGDRPLWFSRGAWALRCAADGMAGALRRPPRVWLPDYFCNQTVSPLRQAGVVPVFYPIDEALRPDWNDCAALAAGDGPPDLFVLVHFFGYPAVPDEARQFCDSHGATMVEDAAHVLAPSGRIGSAGDLVLYSQYKHLPIPDGGLLVLRPSAGPLADAAVRAARPLSHAAPACGKWMAKRLLQIAVPALAADLGRGATLAFGDDPEPSPLPATGAMSGAARRMLATMRGELAAVAARRKENAEALYRALSAAQGLRPLFPAGRGDAVPYRAVFRAADRATAERWYDLFHTAGQVVETWPDLAPEIRAAPDRHRAAIALRDTVLALPVNADRTPEELVEAYGKAL